MLWLRTFDVNSPRRWAVGFRRRGEDTNWRIRYLIIATRNWWPGKIVQLAPYAVKDIDWFGQRINMIVSRDQVKSAPAWEPLALADEAREDELDRHFGWPAYRRPSEGWGSRVRNGTTRSRELGIE
jgi:hypothetical protein